MQYRGHCLDREGPRHRNLRKQAYGNGTRCEECVDIVTSLTLDEITAGLVVRVDTNVLRARGDSQTNAVSGPNGDRAVVGSHDFLIVAVDAPSGICTAVPLFTKSAVGNTPLVDRKKSGRAENWIGTDTYFSHWQHWRIPIASLVAAWQADDTSADNRRGYASGDSAALEDIRVWESRNRSAYRDL